MSKTSLPQRMAGINSREVQEVLVLQVKLPAKGGEVKKKQQQRRVDGVQPTLFNPIPEKFGELQIMHSLKDMFKHFEDMQINSIPETDNLEFVNGKLGKVAGGSVLSYQ